jgi:methionyl aminopeptidase
MILLKNTEEIQRLRAANLIVARTLRQLADAIEPGITTRELDVIAEKCIRSHKARPAFKGYRGYPATLCVSINEEVVHGIPGSRRLHVGDIVSLDVGVLKDGFFGDAAVSVGVGAVSREARQLMEVTRQALYAAIGMTMEGNRLSDVSSAVQNHVESHGFSVVRDFVGHGIGRNLHEDPQIPNFYSPSSYNPKLKAGMVFALEPMVNMGTSKVRVLDDGWTAVTHDGKLSAHFEHTVAVTDNGPVILSALDE